MSLKHEYKTISRCLKCRKKVSAEYVEKGGKLFLKKNCPGCGSTEALVENDAAFYEESFLKPLKKSGLDMGDFENYMIQLYLTDKCNQSCKVCLSKGLPEGEMRFERIKEVCDKKWQKFFLLLGGEPTLYSDLFKSIKLIKNHGKIPLLFTNGLRLNDPYYVKKLEDAGLRVVHLSLDSLRNEVNEKITRTNSLEKKLRAVKNLNGSLMNTLISARIIGGVNEEEIGGLLNFSAENPSVKELWFYPVVPIGRNELGNKRVFTSDVVKKIEEQVGTIKRADFIESRKLLVNTFTLIQNTFFKKLVKNHVLSHSYVLPVRKNSLKPVFPAEEVARINEELESCIAKKEYSRGLLKLARFTFRNGFLISSALSFLNRYSSHLSPVLRTRDILLLNIYMMTSPKTFDFNNQVKEIEYAGANAKRIKFY